MQWSEIYFSFYIEGFHNSAAQQIRIQREIVLHQSIRVMMQLWSSVVEKSGGNWLKSKTHIFGLAYDKITLILKIHF
jgi:hypothetical protein